MSDPIDAGPSEPKPATVKVPGCTGCGGLPHGPATAVLSCLKRELIATRGALAAVRGEVDAVKAEAKKEVEAARAEVRELRWELNQRK